jgi:DNA polymerase III delta prime subunit
MHKILEVILRFCKVFHFRPLANKKKSAAQRIEDHEKLCRIMQKQTFEQIKEVKERIYRMEKMIISGALGIIIALLLNVIK